MSTNNPDSKMSDTKERLFWEGIYSIAKDLLKGGEKIGYGNILMEMKFRNGLPEVIVRSANKNTVFRDNKLAKIAVEKSFVEREESNFDGAQTFTVIWHKGNINRILLDEYQNLVL